jgi:hypothetical protein
METLEQAPAATDEAETTLDAERERVRRQLQERHDFASHLVAYLVINAGLVAIWWFTGAGYFWPAWVLGAWGAGLVLHAWETYLHRPVTDADIDAAIDAEVRRHG